MFSRIINNKHKLNWLWPWIIILAASFIILIPQIMGSHMVFGEDCWFHMNRAYEDMEQIKTGHFSYFLNLFSFDSSGRIVNGLYGPAGGYLEGLLLLIVKSWYRWEIANSFIVLLISGISMYYVSRKLGASFCPGILTGLFYLASFPFDHWVINQNFDGFGSMLLPWFLLAGYRIFRHNFNPVKLAILVAITSQIHIMSTLVGLVFLVVSFILANCYTGRLKVWIKALEAAGLYLLLTINVWGALLEVKSTNYITPPIPYYHFLSINHSIHAVMIMSPIANHLFVELFIFFGLGVIWLILHRSNIVTKFLLIQGLVFLWVSSKYFPWMALIKHNSMVASYVQIPERFLPIAIMVLLLLITQLKPKFLIIPLLLVLVIVNMTFDLRNIQMAVNGQHHRLMTSWIVMINRDQSYHHVENALHINNPSQFIKLSNNKVPDYLPLRNNINQARKYFLVHPDTINNQDIINNHVPIHRSIIDRDVEKITFNAQPNHWIQLPFVKYRHTKVWLNHQSVKPKLNQIHVIKVRPTQRCNVLEAQYQPSRWYEVLTLVEIVAWLSIIVDWILKYRLSRRL